MHQAFGTLPEWADIEKLVGGRRQKDKFVKHVFCQAFAPFGLTIRYAKGENSRKPIRDLIYFLVAPDLLKTVGSEKTEFEYDEEDANARKFVEHLKTLASHCGFDKLVEPSGK